MYQSLKENILPEIRSVIRSGGYTGHTAGLAPGHLQCNLAILPKEYATDFELFCRTNTKPCPVVGMSKQGEPFIPILGESIDLRSDVPLYNIYRDGVLSEQISDLQEVWSDDLVAFAIGCSFSFEKALSENGIAMRHIDQDLTVPMFQTSVQTKPVGPFYGGLVASMRPIARENIDRVFEICERFPHAHGTPIHVGDPSEIGIEDVMAPDWGDSVAIEDGELPVFWACGVTPQAVVMRAKPSLCITHAPGAMLIADVDAMAPIQPLTL